MRLRFHRKRALRILIRCFTWFHGVIPERRPLQNREASSRSTMRTARFFLFYSVCIPDSLRWSMVNKAIIGCALLLLCTSCAIDGRLYTNKVIPYSSDFNLTPAGSKSCEIDDFKVKEPVSRFNISAEWMTSSVYEEANKAGITNIYYADLRKFSLLGGIFSKTVLIVHGD